MTESIAYGKLDATMNEIKETAKAAKADYFIRTMPTDMTSYRTTKTETSQSKAVARSSWHKMVHTPHYTTVNSLKGYTKKQVAHKC